MPVDFTGTLTGKGKGLRLRQGIEQTLTDLQKQQLAPETTAAYEQAMAASRQGLDPYTKQQMLQGIAMGSQGLIGLYQRSRLGLSKAIDIDKSIKSGIMQYGAAQSKARREYLGLGIQAGLSVGQQRLGLEKYKLESAMNYLTGRRRERRETMQNIINSIISGGSAIAASAVAPAAKIV